MPLQLRKRCSVKGSIVSLIQLLIIGLVQGITEWLPISSSGHVLLVADWFSMEGRDEELINAASNLGTLAALLIYFWKDVLRAIGGGFELAVSPLRSAELSRGGHLAKHILIATPFALVGAGLYQFFMPDDLRDAIRSSYTIAATTIIFGIALWVADVRGGTDRKESDLTARHSFWIGASQLVAVLLPGTSRSGITMTMARAFGYARTEAARFSMLIGAPLLAAVSAYGLYGLYSADTLASDTSALTIEDGMAVAGFAFASGIASIWILMSMLKRMSFLPFVIYRLALGALLLAASPLWLGWIS